MVRCFTVSDQCASARRSLAQGGEVSSAHKVRLGLQPSASNHSSKHCSIIQGARSSSRRTSSHCDAGRDTFTACSNMIDNDTSSWCLHRARVSLGRGNLHKLVCSLTACRDIGWPQPNSLISWMSSSCAIQPCLSISCVLAGVQVPQATGLQPVEEHNTGPVPPSAQGPQPMRQSGQAWQVDSQADDTDEAADSVSQLNAEGQAPKQRASASEGQPGASRPPKIPSGPRCEQHTAVLSARFLAG